MTLALYNLLLLPFLLVCLPAWVMTMKKRGGMGTGLLERLGKYESAAENEPKDVIYVHAVSVGEVMMAQKLIAAWRRREPERTFVLAATTATGHAVAKRSEADGTRVIYSPVDLRWITKSVLERFAPRVIILIESEIWPNLLNLARKREIPVAVANARLSPRSARRYESLHRLVRPIMSMLDLVCVPERADVERWERIGVGSGRVKHTGGLKYDVSEQEPPQRQEAFQSLLDGFGPGRPVVLCVSTFSGEEELLATAIREADGDFLPVLVPRHAERRADVVKALEGAGFAPALRSAGGTGDCLILDSTGELKDFTSHADLVVIGKSWLESGGQSPVEAISAGIPVISGPDMTNFQALMTDLLSTGGITQLERPEDLPQAIQRLMRSAEGSAQSAAAQAVLDQHAGAADRMVTEILSVTG